MLAGLLIGDTIDLVILFAPNRLLLAWSCTTSRDGKGLTLVLALLVSEIFYTTAVRF